MTLLFWLLIGWWWYPLKWACRVCIWILSPLLGLLVSYRHGKRKDAKRAARA
jgi:hypothetical protein